jgi:PIN domain nuclease of toxin-antitoxin system
MRLLLDTHTLLWWWGEPEKLSRRALRLLKDPANEVRVSSASALEIGVKTRIGKLPRGKAIIKSWNKRIGEDGFGELPVSAGHALRAGIMPGKHRDPFDRLLAAQSLIEAMPVLGCDSAISDLGAKRVW